MRISHLLLTCSFAVPACSSDAGGGPAAPDANPEGGVMCPMDAKICPDGSGVGRVGPNCEFAPCPEGSASPGSPPPPGDASGAPPGTAPSAPSP
jgi:hypothetical protein